MSGEWHPPAIAGITNKTTTHEITGWSESCERLVAKQTDLERTATEQEAGAQTPGVDRGEEGGAPRARRLVRCDRFLNRPLKRSLKMCWRTMGQHDAVRTRARSCKLAQARAQAAQFAFKTKLPHAAVFNPATPLAIKTLIHHDRQRKAVFSLPLAVLPRWPRCARPAYMYMCLSLQGWCGSKMSSALYVLPGLE